MPIRILIADDQTLLRESLRAALETTGEVVVVGEAADGEHALASAREARPQLVLLDLAMPGLSGLAVLPQLVALPFGPRVVVVSTAEGGGAVHGALRAGAAGYVAKSAGLRELRSAVHVAHRGGTYLCPRIAARVARLAGEPSERMRCLTALTGREREILLQLAEGRSSREVADRLGLSPRTVDSHRIRLLRKLGIRNVQGLVRLAIREGLLPA